MAPSPTQLALAWATAACPSGSGCTITPYIFSTTLAYEGY
jgi:hypothetical protein